MEGEEEGGLQEVQAEKGWGSRHRGAERGARGMGEALMLLQCSSSVPGLRRALQCMPVEGGSAAGQTSGGSRQVSQAS